MDIGDKSLVFIGEGHRKSERYRANLCDRHKFCALRSVLLGTGVTLGKMPAGLRRKMIEIDSEILRLYNRNKEK